MKEALHGSVAGQFTVVILERVYEQLDADIHEARWMVVFNSTFSKSGYNRLKGNRSLQAKFYRMHIWSQQPAFAKQYERSYKSYTRKRLFSEASAPCFACAGADAHDGEEVEVEKFYDDSGDDSELQFVRETRAVPRRSRRPSTSAGTAATASGLHVAGTPTLAPEPRITIEFGSDDSD
jgi:hypothetical protein